MRVLEWLFRTLPEPVAYLLADGVALVLWPYGFFHDRRGRRSGGLHRNVRIAFRDQPPPRRFVWRNVRHLAWMAVDLARLPLVTRENLDRHIDGREFDRLVPGLRGDGDPAGRKGLICVTGHIGVPEYCAHLAGLRGFPLTGVFAPSPVAALNRIAERIRSASGTRVVSHRGVLWSLKKALDRGESVGIAADTSNKETAVHAPFLGTLAATSATPGLLHLTTGRPIAVCTMARVGRMRFRLRVWDVFTLEATGDRDADVQRIAERINDGLSRAILEHPAQWFWHSRRYRRRPEGEVPTPDGIPPVVPTARLAFWAEKSPSPAAAGPDSDVCGDRA